MIGPGAQGLKGPLVALCNAAMKGILVLGEQCGDSLHQFQPDDAPAALGWRAINAVALGGHSHGGNDVMNAVNQRAVHVQNAEAERGIGHGCTSYEDTMFISA